MTPATGDRFTFADYRAILAAAAAGGYRFGRFTEPSPPPGERVVYLRHDIDNCIESALLLAEVEAQAGASATYLTLVRSENYNSFTGANIRRLCRLVELGHEVGLHFSGFEHERGELERDLPECIRRDVELLERAVGTPVRVFSFHNPTDVGSFTVEVPGLVNAYADRFFADALYLSESNMHWRHGSPAAILASGEHPIIQLLVHPLSYREDFRTDRDVLLWFLRDKVQHLLDTNVGQNRILREQGVSLADVAAHLAAGAAG